MGSEKYEDGKEGTMPFKSFATRKAEYAKLKLQKHLKNDVEIKGNEVAIRSFFCNSIFKGLEHYVEKKITSGQSDVLVKLGGWLNTWILYLHLEESFKSERLMEYSRGDILHLDFGFNVDCEFGGTHYAIVVENSNNKKSGTVVVVPLYSIDKKHTEAEAVELINGNGDVFLGVIKSLNANYAVAKINQIRAISKLRIIKPKKDVENIINISAEQKNEILGAIDARLINMFTKQQKEAYAQPVVC